MGHGKVTWCDSCGELFEGSDKPKYGVRIESEFSFGGSLVLCINCASDLRGVLSKFAEYKDQPLSVKRLEPTAVEGVIDD